MKCRYSLVALALATLATDSEAGPLRRRSQSSPQSYQSFQPTYQPTFQPTYQPYYQPIDQWYPSMPGALTLTLPGEYVSSYTPVTSSGVSPSSYIPAITESVPSTSVAPTPTSSSVGDALDEVNAKRAAAGLRPFIRDEGLTQAAQACAAYRASYGLFGHTSNDFAFVPAGSAASAAGCAAYPASYGWMSCCVYDSYTYGGAAWVTGSDGRRYMHLFVR